MNAQLILNILLVVGGGLALVALGGAVVSLTRDSRKRDVQVTVKQDHGPTQIVKISQDSAVVEQLNKVEGIHISVTHNAADASSATSDSKKNRRLEIGALVTGVVASLAAVLPFVAAGEIVIIVVSSIGALFLTSVGVVVARLKAQFTGEEWKANTTRKQVEAIRDAALLRELPPQS